LRHKVLAPAGSTIGSGGTGAVRYAVRHYQRLPDRRQQHEVDELGIELTAAFSGALDAYAAGVPV
jgi:hypothetical protein